MIVLRYFSKGSTRSPPTDLIWRIQIMHMRISLTGMIGWVVNAKTSGKIRVQYYSTVVKDYIMRNDGDGNGVPEMQILRLSGCGNANMNKK